MPRRYHQSENSNLYETIGVRKYASSFFYRTAEIRHIVVGTKSKAYLSQSYMAHIGWLYGPYNFLRKRN